MKIIEDMFEGQPAMVGGLDEHDIAKVWVSLGHVATFWATDTRWARLALEGAPEGRGRDWLSTTERVDQATGITQPIEIVYFPGIVYLGTQVHNAQGDRFIVHLCEVVIPRAMQTAAWPEGITDVPAVIATGGEVDPFPAIQALLDAGRQTRAEALQGIALGTQANDRIDHMVDPDRWITAGEWLEDNEIDPESLLTQLQLVTAESIGEDLMLTAARELGTRASAVAKAHGIIDECRARRVRAGRYWSNQYPRYLLEKACRELRGY